MYLTASAQIGRRAPAVTEAPARGRSNVSDSTQERPHQAAIRSELRDGTRCHCPQRLHATLSPTQEAIVVALRQGVRCCCPWTTSWRSPASSSTRRSRARASTAACGGKVRDLIPREEGPKVPVKTFKDYQQGFSCMWISNTYRGCPGRNYSNQYSSFPHGVTLNPGQRSG